ncbi:MAG: rRNA pseudouridine synthase [Peptococcaceae bacterium]|nr:rRNA pseudouridine synthase [Peptococcaceae bacterium]
MERLHKFMSRHGVASRRDCEEMIAAGRVRVNGKTVTAPGTAIDPSRDRVEVDGRALGRPERPVYIMIYKPRGYLSTVDDPRGRKKVTDLIPEVKERVFPVGRLDYDSEGLLIITNDGDLTYRLTHPSHRITKTYRVRVRGVPGAGDLERLAGGIMLEDGMTAPARIEFIGEREGNALLEVTIHEGRNRQIRRMFEKIGCRVVRLKRIRIGPLSLGDLRPGQYRHLGEGEVRRLKKMAEDGIRPPAGRG